MDVLQAYQEIKQLKSYILTDLRKDPEKEFSPMYDAMKSMATVAGLDGMSILRRCGHQIGRNNVESSTPEQYWRRVMFIPFMDHLNTEFEERFNQLSENSVIGLKLVPTYFEVTSNEERVITHS